MYCDAPDSPRRRGTQTAMHEIYGALCQLLAPALVFTAEEAWRHSQASSAVHLEGFPTPQNRGEKASEQMAERLRSRAVIRQAMEKTPPEKLIGSALDAAGVLLCDSKR